MTQSTDSYLEEALIYVYVAQYVRMDGPTRAGVLDHDCRIYQDVLGELVDSGEVEPAYWVRLRGFRTTPKGAARATHILNDRVEAAKGRLIHHLDQMPPPLVQFILQEIVLFYERGYNDAALEIRVGRDIGEWEYKWSHGLRSSHFCTLSDERVRDHRDSLFELLDYTKLAVIASDYVSSKGGRVDSPHWVPAEQFRLFAKEYLRDKGLSGFSWPREMESIHAVFHALSKPRWETIDLEELKLSVPLSGRDQLTSFIDMCLSNGILRKTSTPDLQVRIEIYDPIAYHEKCWEQFNKPLVDFLLGNPDPPSPSDGEGKAEKEKAEREKAEREKAEREKAEGEKADGGKAKQGNYAITFPPFEDGTSLVFGRGELEDKIALGFDSEKRLTSESIVSWDIHSMDESFICTFQQVGMGKSTLASSIMLQAAFQGIPVVVFDPKPDYIASLVPVAKTFERFPDQASSIKQRFQDVEQDIRGFDLRTPVEFEHNGSTRRLVYQVFSSSSEFQKVGARPLKVPLVVLPPLSDRDFRERCDAQATSLAAAMFPNALREGYNSILSAIFQRYRSEHPKTDYMLPDDLLGELKHEQDIASDNREKGRIRRITNGINGYITGNSAFYARSEDEVIRPEELVQNPGYSDGDGRTVTISVLDLHGIPQEKTNPAQTNYVSNVCSLLKNLATTRQSDRTAQFMVVMDEAANYLGVPTDQHNETLGLIRQGRALGIRVCLLAQSPTSIDSHARNQSFRLVLSKVPLHSVRLELTRWQPNEKWESKLGETGKGQSLIIDSATAAQGGMLCSLFTTPQAISGLSPDQILEIFSL